MTRTLLAGSVLFLLATAGLGQNRDARLYDYRSVDGKFRVKMPRDPDLDRKELATGPGGVQSVPVTTVRSSSGKLVYAVSYADYPDTFRAVPAKTLLDGVRNGLKGTDGKVVKDEETTLGTGEKKVSGREFRVEAGNNAVRARAFLVETRLYQVMVTGPKSSVDSKSTDEFFRSFELQK